MLTTDYLYSLGYYSIPSFLIKYLDCQCIKRLKKISYFCGMDFASKSVYNFKEPISRYDHSLSCALNTWRLTHRKKDTIAALFHDVSTPIFSHVVDYMNKDFDKQESTEVYTEKVMKNDPAVYKCLSEDGLTIEEIANFKSFPIVDNDRPRLCADRFDGIILPGISWSKEVRKDDIPIYVSSLQVFINEDGQEEIGFNNEEVARKMVSISDNINRLCSSSFDNYMMLLLTEITKKSIDQGLFTYDDLFILDEKFAFKTIEREGNKDINDLLYLFKNIQKEDIPVTYIDNVKNKCLNPLVKGRRLY